MNNKRIKFTGVSFCSSLFLLLILFLVASGSALTGQEDGGEFIRSLEKKIIPRDWQVVGPFSAGRGESGINHLWEHGGFRNIQPEKGMKHNSILSDSGIVEWHSVKAKENGKLQLKGQNVNWNLIGRRKGSSMYISKHYAYTEVTVPDARRAIVVAEEIGSFRINNRVYLGGFYGHNYVRVPVVLEKGANKILLSVGGYGNEEVQFKILPVETGIKAIKKDITRPDVRRGQDLKESYIGVPIANTTTQWKRNINVTVRYSRDAGYKGETVAGEITIDRLGPLAFQKPSIPIDIEGLKWDLIRKNKIPLVIDVQAEDHRTTVRTSLPIRQQNEAFKVAFQSKADESTQYYAVKPPAKVEEDKTYGLILSLHGAGVKAYDFQMPAYTQKDWAYVIAPTNRRRFGFGWEHIGRLNTMQTLSDALKKFPINPDRVYLTGHSMGGHGAWVVGTLHPDRFAAIGPSAAWTSVDFYIPYFNRKDRLFGAPRAIAIHRATLRPSRPQSFLENLLHMPAFIVQGGKDDVVPPFHARLFLKRMKQLGYDVQYREVTEHGKNPHFWDRKKTKGKDSVNLKPLMEFFKPKRRPSRPKRVEFHSGSLAESHESYWVRVLQRTDPLRDCRVNARVNENGVVQLGLSNVRSMELLLEEAPVSGDSIQMKVNGKSFTVDAGKKRVSLVKKESGFEVGRSDDAALQKTPSQAGPVRQVYYRPFLLVYATGGTDEWKEITYNQARKFAQYWWRKGNGTARIVPDRDVTPEMMKNYNLVLYGNRENNSVIGKINDQLPVRFADNGVMVGDQKVTGEDLSLKCIYPNPLQKDHLVLVNGGTTLEGQWSVVGATSFPEEFPDYVVHDGEWEYTGMTAAIATGYFDHNWQLDDRFAYYRKDLDSENGTDSGDGKK